MGALSEQIRGEVPFYGGGPLRTAFGTLLPPGGKVAGYVHASGPAFVNDMALQNVGVYTTMQAALARCRSGAGDTVVVLPGHTEDITGADGWSSLVAGTRIVGLGHGALKPTFSFTATTSQLAIDVASVFITGCQFNVDGADGVVNAIDITAADVEFVDNTVRVASGAALKATIAMSVSAARVKVAGNKFFGTATHNVTNCILVDTAVDSVEITDNVMLASATAANGLINVTAAALNLFISRNQVLNSHTASTAAINVGNVAATGIISHNMAATINNGTATAQGIVLGAAALVRCFQNYSCDEPIKSGVLTPAAVAT